MKFPKFTKLGSAFLDWSEKHTPNLNRLWTRAEKVIEKIFPDTKAIRYYLLRSLPEDFAFPSSESEKVSGTEALRDSTASQAYNTDQISKARKVSEATQSNEAKGNSSPTQASKARYFSNLNNPRDVWKTSDTDLARGFWPTLLSYYFITSIVIAATMLPFQDIDMPRKTWRRLTLRTINSTIFLTLLFSTSDLIRRHFTFELPLRDIEDALEEIKNGNFDIQIEEKPEAFLGQLDSIVRDINLMTKELSGIESLRSDFIANISHELKAPLAVLMNYGTLLQDPELSDEKRLEYAKAITRETRRMSSLIGSILNLNRLENQQIYPNRREYDISEQVIECLLEYEEVWERKDILIRNEIDEDVKINADPELLAPVWSNLFSNAVKYTPAGGTITVRLQECSGQEYSSDDNPLDHSHAANPRSSSVASPADQLRTLFQFSRIYNSADQNSNTASDVLNTEPSQTKPFDSDLQENEFVEVIVSDTGIGMSEETKAHIFDKFYQGDKSHSTEGNGLGMSLVKRILDIVGGTISVHSAPGSGSTFIVRVPKRP